MRSLQRAVIGGGFGVLAVAGIASSTAFACTPGGVVAVVGTNLVQPGATVRVEASGYAVDAPNTEPANQHGPVRLTWNSVNGVLLGEMSKPVDVVTATGSVRQVFTMDVTVPASATPSEAFYSIVGSQAKPGGDPANLYKTGSVQIWVTAPAAVAAPAGSGPAVVTPSLTPNPAAIEPTPAVPGASARVTARPSAVPTAGPAATASPSATPSATPRAATTASAPRTPAAAVDPSQPVPVPRSSDIWSGLGTSNPTLLAAPTSAPASSGTSPGAILLGLGVLGLAGAAAVARQTRRVAATATVS